MWIRTSDAGHEPGREVPFIAPAMFNGRCHPYRAHLPSRAGAKTAEWEMAF